MVHSASLEQKYNEFPLVPVNLNKNVPISEVSRKTAKNTAPGTYASTKVRVLEGLCHMPIYARCALWVISLSMRWRLACHKIAVYTKQLSDQKTFTPETVSLHQTALNSEWFPNESILQDSDTRKLDRCCPLVGQEPSHLVGQVPLPLSPCLFHRPQKQGKIWKKHAENARRKHCN